MVTLLGLNLLMTTLLEIVCDVDVQTQILESLRHDVAWLRLGLLR